MGNHAGSDKSTKPPDRLKEGEKSSATGASDNVAEGSVIAGQNKEQHQQDFLAQKQFDTKEGPTDQAIKAEPGRSELSHARQTNQKQ